MLLNLNAGAGPLYRRIYDALKAQIGRGRLAPGERLPSSRALAGDLRVSRNTVVLAYDQLAAEGYVAGRTRSRLAVVAAPHTAPRPRPPVAARKPALSVFGQRVVACALPPAGTAPTRPGIRYDFRYARPPVDEFARRLWPRLLAAHARRSPADAFGYAAPAGHAPLREAIAGYLRRARGITCDAGQIVIVNGSQQALDLAARVLLDPGDRVLVEDPGYHGARLAFESLGARPVFAPVDAEGMDVSRVQRQAVRAGLACVTPCHQFPTGVVMPLARRLKLLDWAGRVGAWIIEDDYVSEFRYEGRPIEALHALDRDGRVLYLGSFSKTLFPSLRLAYMVVPPALLQPMLGAKWLADRYSPTLAQDALAALIASGGYERYLRRASGRNARRRAALIAALREHFGERIEIAGQNAGVHLVVWLRELAAARLDGLIARAAKAGVGIYPVAPYYREPPSRAGLLMGYACMSEAEIRAGVRRLASLLG
jgi:GntR family transcriptional regulator/MocR family aminotransferase